MANPRHGKDKPLFNTRLPLIIVGMLAVVLGVLIWWFLLRPLDVSTVTHVAPHVAPGKIIARAPQIKHKALTAAQLHYYHVAHVAHVMHVHVVHVQHVMHTAHVRYLEHMYE